MKNKNIYNMKQPELGNLILDLRKQKGLTQEELVERCNINVRTIQRIEAGEVSPRSYTIKSILEALGVNSETFFKTEKKVGFEFSTIEKNTLYQSFIAAIILTTTTLVSMVMETAFVSGWFGTIFLEFIFRFFVGLIMIFAVFYYLKGYETLANKINMSSLKSATSTYFILEIIVVLSSLFIPLINTNQSMLLIISGSLVLIIFGIAELVLGISIQKLKNHFGDFTQIIGILKIVNGICLILVILSPVALIITIPMLICETIFLYRMAEN